MLPDVDSLALFVRAAELNSLTKAAEASHIALAAASRRIALLEHRFKTTLLERSPRGVTLTPAGQALLPRARALLIELNQIQAEMRDHATGSKGAIRILVNTSIMAQDFPEDLAAFSRTYPDVRLLVDERWSDDIVRAIQAAEADVGVVAGNEPLTGLDTLPYGREQLAVVVREDHPLAALPKVSFDDVIENEIITLEGERPISRLVATHVAITERSLRICAHVRSFESICRMVDAGMGVGLMPAHAGRIIVQKLLLRVRPIDEEWALRRNTLCVKQERAAALPVAKLLSFLRERAKQREA